jgi:hypothetical protein
MRAARPGYAVGFVQLLGMNAFFRIETSSSKYDFRLIKSCRQEKIAGKCLEQLQAHETKRREAKNVAITSIDQSKKFRS